MNYRRHTERTDVAGISILGYMIIFAVVFIVVMATAIYFMQVSKPSARYIAVIQVWTSNNRTDYNYLNIGKDTALIAGASVALAGCATGTFGACTAAIPPVAAALKGILEDEIITVKSDFTFLNRGNGTARSITYRVAVYSGEKPVVTNAFNLRDLEPGKQEVVPHSYSITLADIAVSAWDNIQGKTKITLRVENLSYAGGIR